MRILILGPESRNRTIKDFLSSKNHEIRITEEEITLDFLEENQINFMISSGYAPIVKESVVSAYRNRIINLHISYLPFGKGIYPNFWSFFEGTPKGVSIHFIDAGIDSGNILFQREIRVSDDDTLQSSHVKLMAELEALFYSKWDDIVQGRYQAVDQKHLGVQVKYHNRTDSEKLLGLLPERWNTPVQDVEVLGAEFSLSSAFWALYDEEVGENGDLN